MEIFKVNKRIDAVCNSERTRYGFRHLATLHIDGQEIAKAKRCYYNRTWERYKFESVLKLLAENANIGDIDKRALNRYIKNYNEQDHGLKAVAMIAKIGEIFGRNRKEKNDWKARMLKAGLENRGLTTPKDWETLTEGEKEKRLNGAIGALN